MSALGFLAGMKGEGAHARDNTKFYKDANGDALVLNKWFLVKALANLPDTMDCVKTLLDHPDFTLHNPNRHRSLMLAFTTNATPFYAISGESCELLGDSLEKLDKIHSGV